MPLREEKTGEKIERICLSFLAKIIRVVWNGCEQVKWMINKLKKKKLSYLENYYTPPVPKRALVLLIFILLFTAIGVTWNYTLSHHAARSIEKSKEKVTTTFKEQQVFVNKTITVRNMIQEGILRIVFVLTDVTPISYLFIKRVFSEDNFVANETPIIMLGNSKVGEKKTKYSNGMSSLGLGGMRELGVNIETDLVDYLDHYLNSQEKEAGAALVKKLMNNFSLEEKTKPIVLFDFIGVEGLCTNRLKRLVVVIPNLKVVYTRFDTFEVWAALSRVHFAHVPNVNRCTKGLQQIEEIYEHKKKFLQICMEDFQRNQQSLGKHPTQNQLFFHCALDTYCEGNNRAITNYPGSPKRKTKSERDCELMDVLIALGPNEYISDMYQNIFKPDNFLCIKVGQHEKDLISVLKTKEELRSFIDINSFVMKDSIQEIEDHVKKSILSFVTF